MSGSPAVRILPAGSMPELVARMLEATPRVRDSERQQALTDRFLAPALPALEALLLQLRAELDPVLRLSRPTMGGRAFPVGQCRGITKSVQRRLENLDPGAFAGAAADGCAAVRDFLANGGVLRDAWGDLRGRHFQNAFIMGALYVDVSNDTVVVTKPKVEILPFAEAGFTPIADYGHYARIAGRYWGHRILPNHLLPTLAPYLPLIQVSATGRLSLGSSMSYMLGLTLSGGFAPSERALAAPALPAATFSVLSAALRGGSTGVAASAEEGRAAAIACCQAYRAEGRKNCGAAFTHALAAGQEANRRLARLQALPAQGERADRASAA